MFGYYLCSIVSRWTWQGGVSTNVGGTCSPAAKKFPLTQNIIHLNMKGAIWWQFGCRMALLDSVMGPHDAGHDLPCQPPMCSRNMCYTAKLHMSPLPGLVVTIRRCRNYLHNPSKPALTWPLAQQITPYNEAMAALIPDAAAVPGRTSETFADACHSPLDLGHSSADSSRPLWGYTELKWHHQSKTELALAAALPLTSKACRWQQGSGGTNSCSLAGHPSKSNKFHKPGWFNTSARKHHIRHCMTLRLMYW